MELKEPIKKRFQEHQNSAKPPLPVIIRNVPENLINSDVWAVYTGVFNGLSVIVSDPEEMVALYTMGYFGKGSLSRSFPSFGKFKKGIPPLIKERQWQRRKEWVDKLMRNDPMPDSLDQSMDNGNKGTSETDKFEEYEDRMDAAEEDSSKQKDGSEDLSSSTAEAQKHSKLDGANGESSVNVQMEELNVEKLGLTEGNKETSGVDGKMETDNNTSTSEIEGTKSEPDIEGIKCIAEVKETEEMTSKAENRSKPFSETKKGCELDIEEGSKPESELDTISLTDKTRKSDTEEIVSKSESGSEPSPEIDKVKEINVENETLAILETDKMGNPETEVTDNQTTRQEPKVQNDRPARIKVKNILDEFFKKQDFAKTSTSHEESITREEIRAKTEVGLWMKSQKLEEAECKYTGGKFGPVSLGSLNLQEENVKGEPYMRRQYENIISEETILLSSESSEDGGKQIENLKREEEESSNDLEIVEEVTRKREGQIYVRKNLGQFKECTSNSDDELYKMEGCKDNATTSNGAGHVQYHPEPFHMMCAEPFLPTRSDNRSDIEVISLSETEDSMKYSDDGSSTKKRKLDDFDEGDAMKIGKYMSQDDEEYDPTTVFMKKEIISISLDSDNNSSDVSPVEKDQRMYQFLTGVIEEESEVMVISDSDCDQEERNIDDVVVRIEKETVKTVAESLSLALEEAFFLSFGLGCLEVIDLAGNYLSLVEMWTLYRKVQTDFVEKYVAYHYFRAKGWVVKPGLKFGGDFLLYKRGPPHYHASYVVLIDVVNSSYKRSSENCKKKFNWFYLPNLDRIVGATRKEVLLCQIQWPDVSELEMETPEVLRKFKVNETLLRRWHATEEREID